MALLTWSDNFSVNIQEIDRQHKHLFDLVNALHDAMTVGKGKDVLGKVLSELIEYTVYHFRTEEKLFQKHTYPETAEHTKQHADLTKQAVELKEQFDHGKTTITVTVMHFLKDWLNNHILVSDKKYGPYLNGKGVV